MIRMWARIGADPLLLRDELLEHVVLQRAAQLVGRDALPLGDRDVEREQHGRGRVDRHRRRHLVERDVAEQPRHVVERRDRDALAADLAERARRGRGRSPSASACRTRSTARSAPLEQELEALVGVLGRAEAGEHAHRPRLAAVHRRVRSARERELPGAPSRWSGAQAGPRSSGPYTGLTAIPDCVSAVAAVAAVGCPPESPCVDDVDMEPPIVRARAPAGKVNGVRQRRYWISLGQTPRQG